MKELYEKLLTEIGEDITREGLKDTPTRAEKAFRDLTSGYTDNPAEIVNGALFETASREMVVVKNIEIHSLCEHHLLPFFGECHVGYLPNGQVLGLSKIARIVDCFARRLQIQERLTSEIAHCIQTLTNAKGVGVVIQAKHLCMQMRGVEKQNAVMTTSLLLGSIYSDPGSRQEFLHLIR